MLPASVSLPCDGVRIIDCNPVFNPVSKSGKAKFSVVTEPTR